MGLYNEYRWTATMKRDGTKTPYILYGYGKTEDEAIHHADFWFGTGGKLSEDYIINKTDVVRSFADYPYEAEDLLRYSFVHKNESIARVRTSGMTLEDQESLVRVIENEDPVSFKLLDTACQDSFISVLR